MSDSTKSGIDVMIFKIFSPKNFAKKLAFFAQNKAKLCKILIITLVEKNANFFAKKLAKIAENCDHNIDPCLLQTLQANPEATGTSSSPRGRSSPPCWTPST
jgi:hypothetical protein